MTHDIFLATHSGDATVTTEPRRLERRTTTDVVAAQLRDEIRRGELAPGTWLRQGQVAERFGVSTTPVREAFALLQAEGLVRIDAHRGAVVFHLTAEDLRESYAIREALESLGVIAAMPKLTPEILRQLESLTKQMRAEEDPTVWADLNNRFHKVLVEASGWPRLSSMVENLRDASSAYIRTFAARGSRMSDGNKEHEEIFEACRAGDVDRAERAVRTHLRHAAEIVIEDQLRTSSETAEA
jgi:DNA-binding GntR family transcriptional regulator